MKDPYVYEGTNVLKNKLNIQSYITVSIQIGTVFLIFTLIHIEFDISCFNLKI